MKTTGCSLDYNCFIKHKMMAIDLSKQQALDADPKAIQKINFTGNLSGNKNINVFHYGKSKRNYFFSQGTAKVL